MSTTPRNGYCTVDDVRRVLQETQLTFDEGALGEDNHQLVVDTIAGLYDWIDSKTRRHWYVDGGIDSDDEDLIPTEPRTRDDEMDIPTHGATVDGADVRDEHLWNENSDALLESAPDGYRGRFQGANEERLRDPKESIRLDQGKRYDEDIPSYTRLRLARKDATDLNALWVMNAEGQYEDWTDGDYEGGFGVENRGDDWWVRVNDRGVVELYLNIHSMDDDIASLSDGVLVDFEYGKDELPMNVRRGVAFLAAADIIIDDEFTAGLPDNGQLINVETKAERWERRGRELLAENWVRDPEEIVG